MKIEMSKREIIDSSDIQNAYMKFYPYMMDYLWDLHTVMNLANLEIAIFKVFPDKEEMQRCVNLLEIDIRDTFKEDEEIGQKEFKKNFEILKQYIEDYQDCGFSIYQIPESINIDNIKDESEPDKKTLHVGKIVER